MVCGGGSGGGGDDALTNGFHESFLRCRSSGAQPKDTLSANNSRQRLRECMNRGRRVLFSFRFFLLQRHAVVNYYSRCLCDFCIFCRRIECSSHVLTFTNFEFDRRDESGASSAISSSPSIVDNFAVFPINRSCTRPDGQSRCTNNRSPVQIPAEKSHKRPQQ